MTTTMHGRHGLDDDTRHPWFVVMECPCDPSDKGLDRAHYLIGPFPDRTTAEQWAAKEQATTGRTFKVPTPVHPW